MFLIRVMIRVIDDMPRDLLGVKRHVLHALAQMFFNKILGVLHYVVAAEHVDVLALTGAVVSSATELFRVIKIILVVGDFTFLLSPESVTDFLCTILLLTEAPTRSWWWGGLTVFFMVTNEGCGPVPKAATVDLDNVVS